MFTGKKFSSMVLVLTICLAAMFGAGFCRAAQQEKVDYYAVYLNDQKMGYYTETRAVKVGKVITTTQLELEINRGEAVIKTAATEKHIETVKGVPLGFEISQDTSGMIMTVTGKVITGDKLEVTINSMGKIQKQVVDWPKGALLTEGVMLLSKKKGLREGTTYDVKMFLPQALQATDTKITIGARKPIDLLGRVVELTEVKMDFSMMGTAIQTIGQVDSDYNMLKMSVPMMGMKMEMISCDKTFAESKNDVIDFTKQMFMASPVGLQDADSVAAVRYHLLPRGKNKLVLPNTDNQSTTPDGKGGLFVTVRPVQAAAGVKFPYKGTDKNILEALKPTPYLQSDNRKIIDLAKEAVGDTKDAAEAVRRIEEFVHNYISVKDLSVGYATALEVAQSKQGDCSEHAVLTTAMCRAVGIPAEVVVGRVFVEEWAGEKNVFGCHAWSQAYIGGKWIGLDATNAAGRFGAGHITQAIGNGDPVDFFGLVSNEQWFKVESLEVLK
ncbi:MAG: transglutaminase domain-containing protein [Sedimentisphaerales bacterium]|nr:transglutaminase domain-containing protein [Sedimentisphaerales bacterium]